jgi:phosphatidylinositol alpha-mannosyltransferase
VTTTDDRPLTIGLVCPYSFETPGGVQNHVLGLAGYLRAQGHDPHILAPGDYLGPSPDQFTSAGAALPVRYNGSVARVNFGPLSAARVRRWLGRGQFDVLHIHEPVTPSISMLALWATDVPVVATFHTATPRSRTMQLAGGALRAAIEKIDSGIAVSESARKVVVQHLGRDAVVIPNGFRHEDFARPAPGDSGVAGGASPAPDGVAARRWRGGDRPRLSFLGRMDEPRKGLDTLLAALPQIRTGFPDLDVVLAGEGTRNLPAGMRTLGIISDSAKAALLASSDVFVAPHVARESFGIVLLEAMASRTAVVASDLPAFVDLLGDPTDASMLGATFPVGDHEGLAQAVRAVLDHPDRSRTAAAEQASRRYDWSVVGAAITEVYRATADLAGPQTLGRVAGR